MDYNPTEMCWRDLKEIVHAGKLFCVDEIKQFCKHKWARSHLQQC